MLLKRQKGPEKLGALPPYRSTGLPHYLQVGLRSKTGVQVGLTSGITKKCFVPKFPEFFRFFWFYSLFSRITSYVFCFSNAPAILVFWTSKIYVNVSWFICLLFTLSGLQSCFGLQTTHYLGGLPPKRDCCSTKRVKIPDLGIAFSPLPSFCFSRNSGKPGEYKIYIRQ